MARGIRVLVAAEAETRVWKETGRAIRTFGQIQKESCKPFDDDTQAVLVLVGKLLTWGYCQWIKLFEDEVITQ